MKVFDLRCPSGHGFEGWFGSERDFQDQHARGLVSCPLCGDAQVRRMPSAPRLNFGAAPQPVGATEGAPAPGAGSSETGAPSMPRQPARARDASVAVGQRSPQAAALWQAMRDAVRSAEDVGTRFAEEARRIHEGEAPERGIRGQASPQETRALLEDGILVLPVPPGLKETLQ
ncbi:MAG: DUF1178 family protein [Xylophilus ampelinus]